MNSLDPKILHTNHLRTSVPSSQLSPSTTNSFRAESDYRRRLATSIGFSCLLNLAFLWLLLSKSFSHIVWFDQKPKPRIQKEVPRLVLIERVPTPKPTPKTFLETDPSQAVPEKPRDSEHYSEHNTLATQTSPSPSKPGDIPKAEGNNTKTMATQTVRPGKPSNPNPPSPAEQQPTKAVSEKPNSSQPSEPVKALPEISKTQDYALLKANPPQQKPSQTEPARKETPPPTPSDSLNPAPSREVLASMSKLEGGVPRVGKALAFNSTESPFATYDKKVIGKIGAYWQFQVVDKFYGEKVGEVEISFKLLASGRISDLRITRNTANMVLAGWCIQALEKSCPFEPFPESMRALVGDFREGTITFAY